MVIFSIVIFVLTGTILVLSQDCLSRDYGNGGTVCVCNENHCDFIPTVTKVPAHQYLLYTSNKAGDRFKKTVNTFTMTSTQYKKCRPVNTDTSQYHKEYEICGKDGRKKEYRYKEYYKIDNSKVYINLNVGYQEIIGFGGCFTDATGINVKAMSPKLQKDLMRSYFSTDGLEYNLARVPMGGTDFSTRAYSYIDDQDHEVNCVDPSLQQFRLAEEDLVYKIPLIQEAMNLTNNTLKLFTSLWTAPKAMKENNDYSGTVGFIIKDLYQLYADYFLKFLDHYLNHSISFWAVSSGNEPFITISSFATSIPGVFWFPHDLGIWIRDYLGPSLQKSKHENVKILTLDDQRPLLRSLPEILSDPITQDYVQGIAVHWYLDNENNTYLLDETHKMYPDKFILGTEGCTGDFVNNVRLGAWDRGERLAADIIQDLNHWVVGWVDWNMVLNTTGGPGIAGPVDSPIIANVTEFYKQPHYYAMGHFSKFIPRGSIRIHASQQDDNLVALKRPDGGIVIVILNRSDVAVNKTIIDCDRIDLELTLTPHSITTVLYW